MTNINVEQLINTVRDRFYDIELCESKPYEHSNRGRNDYIYYERGETHGYAYIRDMSQVLNIDESNLFSIARAARKWEQRHDWQFCFPANKYAEEILKYLQKQTIYICRAGRLIPA